MDVAPGAAPSALPRLRRPAVVALRSPFPTGEGGRGVGPPHSLRGCRDGLRAGGVAVAAPARRAAAAARRAGTPLEYAIPGGLGRATARRADDDRQGVDGGGRPPGRRRGGIGAV